MNTRLSKFKNLLAENNLDAALISSVPDIIYLTGFSHFSTEEREAFLLITRSKNFIITDGRYAHAVIKHIKNFNLLEASGRKSREDVLNEILKSENILTLGIDIGNLSVSEHNKILVKKIKHISLSSLRKIKESDEIEKIKKACQLGDLAFDYILNQIKSGMTEKQIAFVLELFIRRQNADLSFAPIIAFEENSAIPHHKTGNRVLNNNEIILLDFGVKFENYCSDMTRTIFFGKANEFQKKTYQTVLESQQKAIETLNFALSTLNLDDRSIKTSDLDSAARTYLTSNGFPTIPHSLGHGIGLQVHEKPTLSPNSQDHLRNGMVFSIEPGIYLPDQFGIRIEDLFAIQNNQLIQLTRSSKNFIEI